MPLLLPGHFDLPNGAGDFQIQIEKAGVSLLAALLLALVLVFLWLRHHCGRPPAHAASIPQSVGRVEAPSTFVSQPSNSSFVDLEAQLVEGRELVLSQEEKNQRLLWAEQFKVRQLQKLRCADLRACQTLGKKFAPIKKAPTVVLERAPDIVKDLCERHMMSKFSANTAFPTTCEFLYALKPLGALAFNLFNTPGGPVCYIDLAGTVSHVGAGQSLHSELRKIAMERGCKASVLRSLSSACGFWQNVGYSAWSQRMPEQGTLLQAMRLDTWLDEPDPDDCVRMFMCL